MQGETHPKRAVPANYTPEFLKEPLLYSSGFLDQEVPLVSFKFVIFSITDFQEKVRRGQPDLWTYRKSKTGSPAQVRPRL